MKSAIRRSTRIGLALLLVVMAFPPVPTAASGTEQLVMLVPNIPGSSTLSGHNGWIDVLSFAGSAVAPAGSAGQPCQMVVQKNLDMASPHLWLATVTGKIFTSIKVDLVTVGTTSTPFVAYEIQLENVQITSIGDAGSTAVPQETLTFKATKGMVTFNERNPSTGAVTPITVSFTC
jgi:type VI protein secretion system component Hcp